MQRPRIVSGFLPECPVSIQIRDGVTVVQDAISSLPTINTPATQMSTVDEVLNQTISIMESLQLSKIACIFGQGLYAKTAEIVWKNDKFRSIIRMGIFCTICNHLSLIWKRFHDARLQDMCVDASVIADGSGGRPHIAMRLDYTSLFVRYALARGQTC